MNPAIALGLALPTLLVACFLLAAHRSINDWLLPMLTRLAHPQGNFLTRAALWPLARAAQGVASVVNYVDHHLSVAASHQMAPLARFMGGFAAWITTLAYNAAGFTRDTAYGFERLVAHTIPHEIGLATHPLWRWVRQHNRAILALLLPEIVLGKWLYRQLTHHVLPRLKYLYHQTTVVLPRAIAREGIRIGRVETQLAKPTRAFLRRWARLLWAAGLLGLVVRTLARRFPWLFCRNTKSFGNNLCRLNPNLLGSLFADAIILGGSYSLVQFATEVVRVTAQVESAVVGLFRELAPPIEDYLGPNDAAQRGLANILAGGFSDYLD